MNERTINRDISNCKEKKKTTKLGYHCGNGTITIASNLIKKKISQSNPICFAINTLVTKLPKNSHTTDLRSMKTQ